MFKYLVTLIGLCIVSTVVIAALDETIDTIEERLAPGDVKTRMWLNGKKMQNLLFFGVPADSQNAPFQAGSAAVTPKDDWLEVANTQTRASFGRETKKLEAGKIYTWTFNGVFDTNKNGTGPPPTWVVTTKLKSKCADYPLKFPRTVTIEVPQEIQKFIDSVASVIKQAPFVTKASLQATAGVSSEIGQICCCPEQDEKPVDYTKYTGDVALKVDIGIMIIGVNRKIAYEQKRPRIKISAQIKIGPEVEVAASAKAQISGANYNPAHSKSKCEDGSYLACRSCVAATITGDLTATLTLNAIALAHIEIFKAGHWYSINENAKLEIRGGGRCGGSVNASYQFGPDCGNTKKSTRICFDGANIFATISTQIGSASIAFEWVLKDIIERRCYE